MVNYEHFYPGADDSLSPSYTPKVYEGADIGTSSISTIGTAMDARTANQLGELRTKINPGQKIIEVGAVSADAWESVPKQHIEEMRRAMKLAGIKPSFHAPIIEASGYGKEGWDESTREAAERQLESAVLRSQRLDPNGNISVTVHSTAQLPELVKRVKTKEGKEKILNSYIIDPVSGRAQALEQSKRFFPEGGKFEGKEIPFDPEKEIKQLNELQWHSKLSGITTHVGNGESHITHAIDLFSGKKEEISPEILKQREQKGWEIMGELQKGIDSSKIARQKEESESMIKQVANEASRGTIYLKDGYTNMKAMFDTAYASANEEDKKKLAEFAKNAAPKIKNGLNFKPEEFEDFKQVISDGLRVLGEINAPETFKPFNEFVVDKSSQTFANVATSAFKKYKDKAPVINIENPPVGGGLSRAEDLRELVKASRNKLKQNLIKEGLSESEASNQSKKLIGATWDVGHINMLRKEGYSEKDIIKQTEIIAPYVKHVHLSDNFGYEHTELPMGMGNVPMKEIMKRLGEKGFKGKKIIEAGNWWQYFAEQGGGNPFRPTIEAFDSPIYSMKEGPSWGGVSGGGYYSGQGMINPSMHHQIYGAGFSTLPAELGGNIAGMGDASRFSGTPNQ